MTEEIDRERLESLGPAEQLINAVMNFNEHLWHHSPGIVQNGMGAPRWTRITNQNREQAETGALGELRQAGFFKEAARHLYQQILEVYRMDPELVARWASYEMAHGTHRDLKIVLMALLLVQNHAGQAIAEDGVFQFHDDDYRAVGEAVGLFYERGSAKMLNPKHLLRVREVLEDAEIARMNREAGFGRSARRAALGRYFDMLERYLRYRERNVHLLRGLVDAGFTSNIKMMARWCRYKPDSQRFFEILRWEQSQAAGGHREVALDMELAKEETWDELSEMEICQRIVGGKLSYLKVVAKLPQSIGLTRAIMAAMVEAGSLSDKDLLLQAPTLEELGLLNVPEIKARWDAARQKADDQRAANVARRMRSQANRDAMEEAAETALAKSTEEAVRGVAILMLIDISGSMSGVLQIAKRLLVKLVPALPPEQLAVAVFNTMGRVVTFKARTRAAVEHELGKYHAGGGTDYGVGIQAIYNNDFRVPDDMDCIVLTVGDQACNTGRLPQTIRAAGYEPIGICHLHVDGGWSRNMVEQAARELEIPFVQVEEEHFEDTYQIHRSIRAWLESAPRRRSQQKTMVEKILETPLLERPY